VAEPWQGGPYSIVVTDELGQVVGRVYVKLTLEQRARVAAGGVWPVVCEVLADRGREAA
jgi:hypothetical protein